MSISDEDIIKIRNSLEKVVNYIDSAIYDGTKNKKPCPHENRLQLTTMGKGNKEFMCQDCEKIWEEEFNAEELQRFNIRVG